jgi:rfaE bifunctional protein nucleotidyltransferase chain/domain
VAGVAAHLPVVWDPHPRGDEPVAGVRLVTPNREEAAWAASRLGVDGSGLRGLAAVNAHASALVGAWGAQAVAVTLGAGGALLSHGETSPSVIPAPAVRSVDPCGAGDRFAASAALALAGGASNREAVQAAVTAAADFVAAGGAAAFASSELPGSPRDLDPVARTWAAGGTVVATGGCFDLLHAGHVATLEAARALGDRLVVCVNSDASVTRLKGPGRPLQSVEDRVRILQALTSVDDVIVFEEDTPEQVLRTLRPKLWVKGGDYSGVEVPEAAVLAAWGGRVVTVPFLDGRSTTSLAERAIARS